MSALQESKDNGEDLTSRDVPSRQRAWFDAWVVTMTKKMATTKYATDCADVCLREFDMRFPNKES